MWIYLINVITIPIYYKLIKDRKKFVLLVAFQLFLILAMSNISMGIDNGNYSGGYEYIKSLNFSDMVSNLQWSGVARLVYPYNFENGYTVFNWLVSHIGIGFQGFLTICAFINISSISLFVYKFSKKPWLSFVIFCTFGFFVYDFGILRQSLALSMVLFSFVYLERKKRIRSFICFLLAIGFHRVSIMVLPLLLLFNRRPINKKVFLLLLIAGLVLLIFSYSIYQDIILNLILFTGKGYMGHGPRINSMIVFFTIASIITFVMYNFSRVKKGIESVSLYALIFALYLCIFGMYNDTLARSLQFYSIFLLVLVPNGLIQYRHMKYFKLIQFVIYLALVGFMYYEISGSHLDPYIANESPDIFMLLCLNAFAVIIIGLILYAGCIFSVKYYLEFRRNGSPCNEEKKKILFLMTSLSSKGGAERVVVSLTNWITKNSDKYDPIILVFDRKESAYKVNDAVRIIRPGGSFGKNRIIALFRRIKFCRRVIRSEKPKYIVSFYALTTFYAKVASTGDSIIVGSERANPNTKSRVERIMDMRAFDMCDRFIFQTKGVKRLFNDYQNKSIVIPNPINEKALFVDDSMKKKRIIAAGRLTKQKGFDILIDAFKKVSEKNPDYELVIFGEGEDREKLLRQIRDLGLSRRVKLKGRSDSIAEEMSRSKIFVLSSRYEGMPNVLIEAMASGSACISTDCDYGPSDLIENGVNGILVDVDNVDQMADAINELISDDEERKSLEKNAYNINKKLSPDVIYRKYLDYIVGNMRDE